MGMMMNIFTGNVSGLYRWLERMTPSSSERKSNIFYEPFINRLNCYVILVFTLFSQAIRLGTIQIYCLLFVCVAWVMGLFVLFVLLYNCH